MPPAAPGSLNDSTYAAISDFIASANSLPSTAGSGIGKVTGTAADGETDEIFAALLRHRRLLLEQYSPVTDASLKYAADGDWPAWRRTSDSQGFSPLTQIDRSNVARLTVAWSISLSPGSNAIAPLVHDGILFLNTSGKVAALDAQSGDTLWEYSGAAGSTARVPMSQPRTIALYSDAVYVPTLDGHVLALEARTGKLRWDHALFAAEDKLELTAGPLVVRNKVIQGVSGCQGSDYRGGCFIAALDADTGKEMWRFHTIARPGQPGGDSWNGATVEQRFGGSVWSTGSYDPELNLAYFGVGQTYNVATLLAPNARRGKSGDALFTDSTLALNPDTGALVWFYQHQAGDVWDLDWAFERSLVTLPGRDGPRKAVVTGGKIGVFDVLDARTGRYLFSSDVGLQNLVQSIDPRTGLKTINPAARYGPGRTASVCPFIGGGRNWLSTAYDPNSPMLFVPMVESCMQLSLPPSGAMEESGWVLLKRPRSDGKFGVLAAIDLRTHAIAWVNRRRAPPASALLATAGGLVFDGSRDRTFRASDSATGAVLWEAKLNDTPNGFPISFAVAGTQYIAVIAGGGTPLDAMFRSFTPEIPNSSGARTLWVFALGAAR